MFDQFTLGIEEEFQIVDPRTRELRSHVVEILEEGTMLLGEQIKPEMIQSMVEVGTGICANIQEARADITNLRSVISSLARKNGLVIVAASTHPISRWQDQKIFDDERYELLVQELQTVARSLLIFGLHVHVGIPDRERSVHIMNAARYFLPHVLALTTSSPFWMAHNTGLKSYRCEVFKQFPRTDIPDHFDSHASFQRYIDLLVKTGCIDNGKKIWWDVRPNWNYPTLEFRICDVCTRVEEAVAVAAILQAIVAKLWKLRRDNMTFRVYPAELVRCLEEEVGAVHRRDVEICADPAGGGEKETSPGRSIGQPLDIRRDEVVQPRSGIGAPDGDDAPPGEHGEGRIPLPLPRLRRCRRGTSLIEPALGGYPPVDIPKTLVVTNDFPPRVGGIQRTLESLCRELPPDRISVIAPSCEGSERFDASVPFTVVRERRRFVWPTPGVVRRLRAEVDRSGAEVVLSVALGRHDRVLGVLAVSRPRAASTGGSRRHVSLPLVPFSWSATADCSSPH